MRIACWIPKAANTHSQYVILFAFPQQQWLHEHDSLPRYTCNCLPCWPISRGLLHHYFLGYGYIGARTDTTQQSGQTPDKKVEIKNITIYVRGYTETDTAGILSPPNVWRFSVAADIDSNVFEFYFLIWSLSRLLCCVGSGFNVAAALCRGYEKKPPCWPAWLC